MRWSFLLGVCAVIATGAAVAACNDSKGYVVPGPRPQILSVEGPNLKDGGVPDTVECDLESNDGACPITIRVLFRLPAEHFVWKAYVRFPGDGNDVGIDRGYLVEPRYGAADGGIQSVEIHAAVPPDILRRGGLFTYSVRLLTGTGEESEPSTQPLSIEQTETADGGSKP